MESDIRPLNKKGLFKFRISHIGLSKEECICSKQNNVWSDMTLTFDFKSSFIDQRHPVDALDKDFSYNSAMTFTFELETWFRVNKILYSKVKCM